MSLTENLGFKKSGYSGTEKLSKDNSNFISIDSEIEYLKSTIGVKEGIIYIDNPIDFIGALVPTSDYVYFNGFKYENKIKTEFNKIILTKDISLKGLDCNLQFNHNSKITIPSHIKEIISRGASIDFNNKFYLAVSDFVTLREILLHGLGNGLIAIDTTEGFLTVYNVIINFLNGSIQDSYSYKEESRNIKLEQANVSNISNLVINGIANEIIIFKNISNLSNITLNLLRTDINKTATIFHSVANVNNFFINHDLNESYTNFKSIFLTCGSFIDDNEYNEIIGGLINSSNISTNNCSIGGLVGNEYLPLNIFSDVSPIGTSLTNVNSLFIDTYYVRTNACIRNCSNIYINTREDVNGEKEILEVVNSVNIIANNYELEDVSKDHTRNFKLVTEDTLLNKYDRKVYIELSDIDIEITIPDDCLNIYEFSDITTESTVYSATIIAPTGYDIEGDSTYTLQSNQSVVLVLYGNTFYIL